MMFRRFMPVPLAALAACNLTPPYSTPAPAIPTGWPVHDPHLIASEAQLSSLDYRAMFIDPRLQSIIAQSLANNQDVKLALANIGAARGLYRVQRSALLPTVQATGDASFRYNGGSGGSSAGAGAGVSPSKGTTASYTVDVGASAFELDLFGRVRSLSAAALDTYLATESAARATRLTLVGDVASAWVTLASDRSLQAIAGDTIASAK